MEGERKKKKKQLTIGAAYIYIVIVQGLTSFDLEWLLGRSSLPLCRSKCYDMEEICIQWMERKTDAAHRLSVMVTVPTLEQKRSDWDGSVQRPEQTHMV